MNNSMSRTTGLTGARLWRARKLCIPAVLALLVVCPLLDLANAAAGDLDTTFGNDGKVVTDFFGNFDTANDVAVQPDGKIIAAGVATLLNNFNHFALTRYNSDGSLDPTFGSGGKVITEFPNASDTIQAIALQPDGKIVAAGQSSTVIAGFALARYNSDGSLDPSFGSGGLVTTNFFDFAIAEGVAIQPDGKIVVAGNTSPLLSGQLDFAIARYNSDGSLDATFGSGGKVTTDFFGNLDQAADLIITADGKIVVGGTATADGSSFDFAMARYNSNGSLDPTFGSGGKVTTNLFGGFDVCFSINLQTDGKLVLTGDAISPVFGSILAIARYNSDGSLDPTFGSGGISDANVRAGSRASLILPNGKIIAAGLGFDSPRIFDFVAVRYNSDGSLDTTFGIGGKMIADFFGNLSQALAVASQSDGKVVLAGNVVINGQTFDFALARFNGDGPSFDFCIQADGGGIFQFNSTTGDYQFTNCAGITITGTGSVTQRGSLVSLDHSAVDRRVMVRVTGIRATASVQLFSPRRTFNIADTNIANNTCGCR